MRRSTRSRAGTRKRFASTGRAAAATTASDSAAVFVAAVMAKPSPPPGRGECPQRWLGVADRPVERAARLGEQPVTADHLEVDDVVLDRDVLAIGEVMGDRGRHPGAPV